MTAVGLYVATQKLAGRVKMAVFRVHVRNCSRPGYLCPEHLDAVKEHADIVKAEVMSSIGRRQYNCDLCWAGMPLKVRAA